MNDAEIHIVLSILAGLGPWGALVFFGVVNVAIFAASVALCWALGRHYRRRRIFDRWEPFSMVEGLAALASVVLNTLVSVAGWHLWVDGYITLHTKSAPMVLVDVVVMVLAMDFGMYLLHRLAHHPRLFPLFHRFHHRHEVTNPISLFVLHPLEVLGFGGLMILFLVVYPMDPVALTIYLGLNVLFGTLGHSGVEPFPARLERVPLLRLVGTSTFHAEHHEHPAHNFGFYTLIWDQLLGTLDPDYWARYRGAVGAAGNVESAAS